MTLAPLASDDAPAFAHEAEVTSVRAALRSPRRLRTEVLGGLVVALALIPEAIAFSIIAGVDPRIGLFASFTMAVTIAFVGGRPAMISAATGAVALVDRPAGARARPGLPDRHRHPGRRHPDGARRVRGGQADAVHPALGDGRLRQRPGDPDLPGPGART